MAASPAQDKNSKQPFLFSVDAESLQAWVNKAMLDAYEKQYHTKPDYIIQNAIEHNSETIAEITLKVREHEKKSLKAGDTPETVAARVAKGVEEELRRQYASGENKFLGIVVDGLKKEVFGKTIVVKEGIGEGYFSMISNGIKEAATESIAAHSEEFAALKPVMVAEAPKQKPSTAQKVVDAVVGAVISDAGANADTPPPESQKTGKASTKPLPPEEPIEAEPFEEPAPSVSSGNKGQEGAAGQKDDSQQQEASSQQPPKQKTGQEGAAGQKDDSQQQEASSQQPPKQKTGQEGAAGQKDDSQQQGASSQQQQQSQDSSGMPASLSGMFTTLYALSSDPDTKDFAISTLKGLMQPEAKDSVKGYIRSAIDQMGQDQKDYSEQDVDGFATVIQEAGNEWLSRHEQELTQGNLPPEQIRELSRDFAMGVRMRMTPSRVGNFAGSAFFVSKPDVITGVDEKGVIARPYNMTLQGLAEAALTGAAGNDWAKQRYQEQLAYEESYKAFYASEEGKDGLSAQAAVETARFRMQQSGHYSTRTQAAVEQMTEESFQSSGGIGGMFGNLFSGWGIGGLLIGGLIGMLAGGGIGALLLAVLGLFVGSFAGEGGGLSNLLTGFKDGSLSAHRSEKQAAAKNFDLYDKIVHEKYPDKLGYDGPAGGFEAWKTQLAEDVTGLHYDPRRQALVDLNLDDGSAWGIAARIQGLDANGYSRVQGQEGIPGKRHEYSERTLQQGARTQGQMMLPPNTSNYQQQQGQIEEYPPAPPPVEEQRSNPKLNNPLLDHDVDNGTSLNSPFTPPVSQGQTGGVSRTN